MTDVFISYAREDRKFVQRLHDALAGKGRQSWVDWEGIPASAKWMAEVRAAIDEANCFCFVVSPDSVESPVCREEAAHAAASNKRILPLLHREVADGLVPETVAAHNWIEFSDGTSFDEAFAVLVKALETEPEHLRAHTRLLVRSKEWEGSERDRSHLLRGSDLNHAEGWLASSQGKEPAPTQGQTAYVLASRKAASRRQRTVVGAVAIALVLSLVLSAVAIVQRGEALDQREAAEVAQSQAEEQAAVSLSRELAASSTAQLSVDPELSVLLGLEAADAAPTAEAADALRDALIASRHVGTLSGHENPILDASFSTDGTRLLTNSYYARGYVPVGDQGDHSVRVWDLSTGQQISAIETGTSSAPVAEFGPDGDTILISNDGVPAIWDAETGTSMSSFGQLDPGIAHLSPSGDEVVGACHDGSICVIDATTGEAGATLTARGAEVTEADFTPGGTSVVGFSERAGYAWDPRTGALRYRLPTSFDIEWMSVSADGEHLLLSGLRDVAVWVLDRGQLLQGWDTNANLGAFRFPVEPAINADGSRVATMNGGGTITVWNARSGSPVSVLPSSSVPDVEFSPDGHRVLTVSEDHTAVLWDAATGRAVAEFLGAPSHMWLGRFSEDGSQVVTAGGDLSARLWVVDPGAPIAVFTAPPGGDGQTVTFAPDGNSVITGGYAGLVRMWDVDTGEQVQTYTAWPSTKEKYRDWIWKVAVSPDGSQVASASSRRAITLFDAATGERTSNLRFPPGEGSGSPGATSSFDGVVWSVTYSPDGSMLASSSQDGVARVWDPQEATLLERLAGHEAAVNDSAFSPDGTKLLTGSDDGTARVWDVQSGRSLMTFEGQPQGIVAVAWSPDGRFLATGSYDATVNLLDAATGRTLQVLTGSRGVIHSADFSPNSRWLATLSDEDGAMRVWEVPAGRLVDIHQGVLGSMGYSVDFSPDGTLIAVPGFTGPFGAGVGETVIYRCELCTDLEGLIAIASQRVTRELTDDERRTFLHEP